MMVVGDFGHDGNMGVITTTTSLDGDTVIYLAGKGNGGFEPARRVGTGLQTTGLATADVNGDGLPDLIAGSAANGTVRVLFGNSSGGFNPGTDYPAAGVAGGLPQQSMTLADFSGTGKPDLAVVNTSGSFMQLLYNDGTGHFHLQNSYATGTMPSDVETADLNADGHLDLVETDSADGTLGVRLGNGDGSFQALQTYQVGANPQRLLLVDVDGDGILDAVTVNTGGDSTSRNGDGTVSVLLGNGDGTFRAARDFNAGPNVVDVAAGDMDKDGKLDLVVANSVVNGVSILRGNGDGSFKAPVRFFAGTQINALAVGDLGHSGFLDVVTVGGTVAVLHNDHKGGLTQPTVDTNTGLSRDLYLGTGVRITLADIRHVNQLDALIADSSNSQLAVLTNFGGGLFRQTRSVFPTCGNPRSLALADLNADGNKDVVVACGSSGAVGVMLGNGQGGFLNTPYPAEITPRGVAIGDFNEDGQPDLAVVDGDSDIMTVTTQIPGVVASDRAPVALSGSLTIANGRDPQNSGFEAFDPDNDPLVYVATTLPVNGTFSYNPADGSFSYQANTGIVGTDTAEFQVSDGIKLSNVAKETLVVQTNPVGGSSHGGFLGTFWLPLLPILGLFAALRRRRRN
jgi:VCBS repeat protein/Big-like domain-containing protein